MIHKSNHVYEYEMWYLNLLSCVRSREQIRELQNINRSKIKSIALKLRSFFQILLHPRARSKTVDVLEQAAPIVFGPHERPSGTSVFIDITATIAGKVRGGISSATRALAETGWTEGLLSPVIVVDGAARLYVAGKAHQKIAFQSGDVYAIIDHYWDALKDYPEFLALIRGQGVHVAACIYDLIPLDYPSLFETLLPAKLSDYLPAVVQASDTLFSVSQSSAKDIQRYLKEADIICPSEVAWFHIGAVKPQIVGGGVSETIRKTVRDLFEHGRTFLSVGYLNPHKGHPIAVKAFERLWKSGSDDKYVLMGPYSGFAAIEDWIRSHPMFGSKLFRCDDASDAEVIWAYDHAECLIQPSLIEGFGLPIIEANFRDLPIIASDIPVFRELGQNSLRYFECCNADALAREIDSFRKQDVSRQKTAAIEWSESARMLRDVLLERSLQISTRIPHNQAIL